MPNQGPRPDDRVSLHGLTPEEALRALLAVDPCAPPVASDDDDDDAHDDPGT